MHGSQVDVRGDGSPDELWTYVMPGEGAYVDVSYAAGGSTRLALEASPGAGVEVLGADDGPDGTSRVWLNLRAASGVLVGLVIAEDCVLREVRTEEGEPLALWTGGDVRSRAGIDCLDGRISAWTYELAWDEEAAAPLPGEPGDLTVRRYRLEGHTAVLVASREETGVPFDEAVTGLACASLE